MPAFSKQRQVCVRRWEGLRVQGTADRPVWLEDEQVESRALQVMVRRRISLKCDGSRATEGFFFFFFN